MSEKMKLVSIGVSHEDTKKPFNVGIKFPAGIAYQPVSQSELLQLLNNVLQVGPKWHWHYVEEIA